jgi:uncharacterized membrane protein YqaE (UPF0057 family)
LKLQIGIAWLFQCIICDVGETPFGKFQPAWCDEEKKFCFGVVFNCQFFESFTSFIAGLCGTCILICWFFPVAFCLLVFLLSLALQLVFYCPPLAILTSAMPCMRARESHVYDFFEKQPQQRADPSIQGHVTVWHEIGWLRAFFLCCLLTCFGFFPGVIFAVSIAILHILKYMGVCS